MLKNRSVLLAVSVLCVGILIMPYTVSLFSTQHGWIAAGDVDCLTCHTDITEPGAGYMHSTLGTGKDYCDSCHQGSPGSEAGVTGLGGFDDEHAAVTVECLDCHEDIAGTAADVWYEDGVDPMDGSGAYINITTEAHHNMTGEAQFSEGAWLSPYLAGNNEACIACHSNVTVEVWFVREAEILNITATENLWGNWSVDFTVLP